MNNDNGIITDKGISLWDLCATVLQQWRVIILSMLLGAVIFAGVGYVQSVRNVAVQKENVEKAKLELTELLQEAEVIGIETGIQDGVSEDIYTPESMKKLLEEQMTEAQLNNVESLLKYEKLYEDRENYIEKSILMHIDPNNTKRADITFRIVSQDITESYNIQKIYEDVLTDGKFFEEVATRTGMETTMLCDNISLEKSSYNAIEGFDSIRMCVKHYDQETCARLVECIIEYVNEKCEEFQDILGSHEVVVVQNSIATLVDTAIMTYQKTYLNEVMTLQNSIVSLKKAFGVLEWQYYDICLNGELTELSEKMLEEIQENANQNETTNKIDALEKIIETGVTATPSIGLKYIILGMILAAFAYVFFIFLLYILNNKVRATDNLQDIYGIHQLGQIPKTQEKKKLFGFVDGWILLLRDRNKRKFTETEAMELATVAVKMAAGKAAVDSVYLLGCDLKERSLAVCEQIKGALREDNLQIHILNNILYDAQTMAQLEDAKCVVLVEKVGSTLYDEIAQELELLKRQEIAVLGGIVVE